MDFFEECDAVTRLAVLWFSNESYIRILFLVVVESCAIFPVVKFESGRDEVKLVWVALHRKLHGSRESVFVVNFFSEGMSTDHFAGLDLLKHVLLIFVTTVPEKFGCVLVDCALPIGVL